MLCCNCLGCPDFDDADTQHFLRADLPESIDLRCKNTLTHQDLLADLYDYFQNENRDEVFLECPVRVL